MRMSGVIGAALACLVGCGDSGASVDPAEAPAPAVASTTPPAAAPAREPACAEGPALADFACRRATLCATLDRDDDRVALHETVCRLDDAAGEGATTISAALAAFPARFLRNFTLKHGTRQRGLRGHFQEIMEEVVGDRLAQNSQSADLDYPRVIVWDEQTGLTLSWNGGLDDEAGGRSQTGAARLDILGFDEEAETFALWALDLPLERGDETHALRPFRPTDETDNCRRCHGPESRPIWPMYPDWPGFYGSDNDELSQDTEHQRVEAEFLRFFRDCVAGRAPDAERCASAGAPAPEGGRDPHGRYGTLFTERLEGDMRARFAAVDQAAVRGYILGLEERLGPARIARFVSEEGLAAVHGRADALRAWLGLTMHERFPYRPNHDERGPEASRAFAHRPNLRLGILYNRLLARALFRRIRADETYRAHGPAIAYALAACGPGDDTAAVRRGLSALAEASQEALDAREMAFYAPGSDETRVLYPALLATLGLRVRDVDIRYTYANRRFDRFDEGVRSAQAAPNIMALGYLRYGARGDFNEGQGAPAYWNSYFDGTATMDEMLLAKMLVDLEARVPALRGRYHVRTLEAKYTRFASRWALDGAFFREMDRMSGWFPLPYPRRLKHPHHRESFRKRIEGERVFPTEHEAVCSALRDAMGGERPTSEAP